MNACLGFKSKCHSESFHSDFPHGLHKRFILAIIIFFLHTIWLGIDDGLNFSQGNLIVTIWTYVRILGSILWIIYVYWMKRRYRRYIKRAKLNLFILDLLALVSTAEVLPMPVQSNLTDMASTITGWNFGVYFVCSIMLIGAWQLRVLACIVQLTLSATIIITTAEIPTTDLINLFQVFCVYVAFTYLNEKYYRIDFLERTKIHEDSNAIRKVLDDILEGIVIIDGEKQVQYFNESAEKIFKQKISTVETAFQDFIVQAIKDHSGLKNYAEVTFFLQIFINF